MGDIESTEGAEGVHEVTQQGPTVGPGLLRHTRGVSDA